MHVMDFFYTQTIFVESHLDVLVREIQHAILLLSDRFTSHRWFPGTQSGKAHGQVFKERLDRPGVDFETKASKLQQKVSWETKKQKFFESSLFHFFSMFFVQQNFSCRAQKIELTGTDLSMPLGLFQQFLRGLASSGAFSCVFPCSIRASPTCWQECGNVSDQSILRTPAFNLQGLVDDFHALTPNNWDRCIQHVQHILS